MVWFAVILFIAGALFGFATKCGIDESERGGMVEMHTNRWPWGLMVDIVTHGGRGLVCVSVTDGEENKAWIHNISVVDHCRRRGYGRQLMKLAERKAKLLGCEMALLRVDKGTFQEQWYRRLGYVETMPDQEEVITLYKYLK